MHVAGRTGKLRLRREDFRHWQKTQPSREVSVQFDDGTVQLCAVSSVKEDRGDSNSRPNQRSRHSNGDDSQLPRTEVSVKRWHACGNDTVPMQGCGADSDSTDDESEDAAERPQTPTAAVPQDGLQLGQLHRREKRQQFAALFEGPFNPGKMCVECIHCAALLWPSECSKVR